MGDGEAIIREIWRRWNEGERRYNPDLMDPEIEIHSALTGQLFHGPSEAERWIAEIDDQFEEWELSIDEVDADLAGPVRGPRVRSRPRTAERVDLDQTITWNVELRDGRLVRLRTSSAR